MPDFSRENDRKSIEKVRENVVKRLLDDFFGLGELKMMQFFPWNEAISSVFDTETTFFRENGDLGGSENVRGRFIVEIKLEEAWNREIFDQNSSVNLILLELRKTDWIFREIVKNPQNLDC